MTYLSDRNSLRYVLTSFSKGWSGVPRLTKIVSFDIYQLYLYLFLIRLVLGTWDNKKSIWSARILRPLKIRYSMRDGINGIARSGIFACSGDLLPFWLLHLLHAVTEFIHLSSPPFESGTTWSLDRSFSVKVSPQYIQVFASLWKSVRLVNGGV